MPTSRHILVVGDDPIFLAAMTETLRQSRYRVTTAEHFDAALNLLESPDKPDILVTDIVMPRSINGVVLARMARLRHPKLAAVFITGHRMIELEQMTFGPVLRKPIEPAQLIAAMEAEHARRAGETTPSPLLPAVPPAAA
jgi:two-component system cell cycle sensor histidine kinase/response regulator CckA